MKYRNVVFSFHRSIGLLLGLWLILISLSGAIIVFQKELDHAFYHALWQVTPQSTQVSLDTMTASVVSTHPKHPLWFIEFPEREDQSYVFNQKLPKEHRLQTFINPYTGKVLGSRIWEYSAIGFPFTLHHDFFMGQFGMVMVGVSGGALLLMTITGILLWPSWRSLRGGFKIRWRSPLPLLSYDLHKTGGILSGLFFSVTAVTGVIIVIVHFLPMFNEAPDTKPLPNKEPIALSVLVQKANQALPEGKVSMIEFPDDDRQVLLVRKKLPNQETGRFDLSTVEVNRYSGKVGEVSKVVKADPFFQFLVATADLHFGTFGGLPTRLLYLLVGMMPTALFGTGLAMFLRKRRASALKRDVVRLERQTQTPTPR
jgi:uncharacterized iron-regulated membrane protein